MSFSVLKPSASWMLGSRRMRSSVAACLSSLAAAVIFSPFLVVMVSAEIRVLANGCSLSASVPSSPSVAVHAFLSSEVDMGAVAGISRLPFVVDASGSDGIGRACRLRCVVGDAVSGRSVIVFLRFGSSSSCCSVACFPAARVSIVWVSGLRCDLWPCYCWTCFWHCILLEACWRCCHWCPRIRADGVKELLV